MYEKNIKQGKYGYNIFHNGNLFKSFKEYKISLFLEKNNIDYLYEKEYPNQIDTKFKYDFFIPNENLYIEYCGMMYYKDNKKYIDNIESKKKFCQTHNFNCVFADDYGILISILKNIFKII